jgi:hypothetical protein
MLFKRFLSHGYVIDCRQVRIRQLRLSLALGKHSEDSYHPIVMREYRGYFSVQLDPGRLS